MNKKQFENFIKDYQEKFEDGELGFDFAGVRFEKADREVDEVLCFESKDDSDRADARDFPDFESEEYDELPDMGGVSSWDLEVYDDFFNPEVLASQGEHCYIIAGDDGNRGDFEVTCDEGEVVITRPTVLAKLW